MAPPQLILASASPRRASLLRRAGIPFRALPARVREHEPPTTAGKRAAAVALHNARLKAGAVARACPGRWVLGADTVVALDGRLYAKPRDLAHAARMLSRLQGRTHRVTTGVCLRRAPGGRAEFTVTSRVTFRPMDAAAIAGYLKRVHALDKAGAYAAQERAHLIILRVRGSWSNVVGLPMERLRRELRALGLPPGRGGKRLAFSGAAP
jgi:septum formation protein